MSLALAFARLLLSQPERPVSKPRSVYATATVQLCDAAQHMAMSTSQASIAQRKNTTPPTSFTEHPLTPLPTNEKPLSQVQRVIALLKAIRAGKHTKQDPWIEFQLAPGECNEIERQLSRYKALLGYVKDKIWCVCSRNGSGGS